MDKPPRTFVSKANTQLKYYLTSWLILVLAYYQSLRVRKHAQITITSVTTCLPASCSVAACLPASCPAYLNARCSEGNNNKEQPPTVWLLFFKCFNNNY